MALGQDPQLHVCREQMYQQATGHELSNELSAEEKVDAIKSAFAGKKILLVLDDCWNKDHVVALALTDIGTESCMLISSRDRSLLLECDIVDVGKPTVDDAVKILMSAAGMPKGCAVPPKASEVAELAKLLPLTLGIVGRLVKDLGLQQEWGKVVSLMNEQLSGGGDSRSAEASIIAASLNAIKGNDPATATATARLFRSFAMVPEDCKIPQEALAMVFEAEMGEDGPTEKPERLDLRRYTKILIDRSLVLGPIDKPSMHDLVLDFAIAQHPKADLRSKHRRLVNLIRARRPMHDSIVLASSSRSGWDLTCTDDRLGSYVVKNVRHHIAAACNQAWSDKDIMEEIEALGWLDDYTGQQDAIPVSTAAFLGAARCTELAQKEERCQRWWCATLRHHALALASDQTGDKKTYRVSLEASLAAIRQVRTDCPFLNHPSPCSLNTARKFERVPAN